jgi:hypothetical protein
VAESHEQRLEPLVLSTPAGDENVPCPVPELPVEDGNLEGGGMNLPGSIFPSKPLTYAIPGTVPLSEVSAENLRWA